MALSQVSNFGTNYLSPALTTTSKSIFTFSKNTLVPGLANAGKGAGALVIPVLSSAGKGVGTLVSPALNQTGEWMSQHPVMSIFYAGSALTFFMPVVGAWQLYWVLGYNMGVGPIAGTAAASAQAAGIVSAGSMFATVQSASMGGYGASAVLHAVRIGSAGVGILTTYFGNRNGTVAA